MKNTFICANYNFINEEEEKKVAPSETSSPIKTNRERNSFLLKGIKYINKYCALSDQNMNEKIVPQRRVLAMN